MFVTTFAVQIKKEKKYSAVMCEAPVAQWVGARLWVRVPPGVFFFPFFASRLFLEGELISLLPGDT